MTGQRNSDTIAVGITMILSAGFADYLMANAFKAKMKAGLRTDREPLGHVMPGIRN